MCLLLRQQREKHFNIIKSDDTVSLEVVKLPHETLPVVADINTSVYFSLCVHRTAVEASLYVCVQNMLICTVKTINELIKHVR